MKNTVNDQPLVSVIMNCFNGEVFMSEAIKTVLSQTYLNWELIFWDNQSKDRSAEIFKSFNDKRLKYYYSDKHTSLYNARNLAIKKSNWEFISFLDVDDLWEKNKLEQQMHFFSNPEVDVVFSNLWITKKNVNKKKYIQKKNFHEGKFIIH